MSWLPPQAGGVHGTAPSTLLMVRIVRSKRCLKVNVNKPICALIFIIHLDEGKMSASHTDLGFPLLQDHVFLCEGEDPKSAPKGELLFGAPSRPDKNKQGHVCCQEDTRYLKKAREMGSVMLGENLPAGHHQPFFPWHWWSA